MLMYLFSFYLFFQAISEALAGEVGDADADELEEELANLEAETLELPDVPDQELPEAQQEVDEDDEEEVEQVKAKPKREAVAV